MSTELIQLGKVSNIIAPYQSRSDTLSWEDSTDYLILKNTQKVNIDWTNSVQKSFKLLNKKYLLEPNDLVIDKSLNVSLVKDLPKLPLICNQNQFRLVVTNSSLLPEFVLYYIRSEYFKRLVRPKLKNNSLQVNVLKEMPVPMLTIEQQTYFIKISRAVEKYREKALQAIGKMELISSAVINKLIETKQE